MRIALLHDAVSADAAADDLDVLAQLDSVGEALARLGHETAPIACSLDLKGLAAQLRHARPDLVFNLVESLEGQGRLIHLVPAVLDGLGIPFTGAPTEAMFTTSSKPLSKEIMAAGELPTPAWVCGAGERRRGDLEEAMLPQRVIIKSVWEHASRGLDDDSVVMASSIEGLLELVCGRATGLGGEAFAEAYIEGREFNLSMLEGEDGPEVLPPSEMRFEGFGDARPRIVGYKAKWDDDSAEYRQTVRSFEFPAYEDGLLRQLSILALRCWRLFGLRGYARVDFRVDEVGRPWVLEVNANPCLSPDAGFAAALGRAGIEYERAVERIVRASAPGDGGR